MKEFNGKKKKSQSKGMMYVSLQSGTQRSMNIGNSKSIQQPMMKNETTITEVQFVINAKLKNIFQKDTQAYHLKKNESDESIVR